MQKFLSFFFAFLFCLSLQAQTAGNFWTSVSKDKIQLAEGTKPSFEPDHYQALSLDLTALKAYLQKAPKEFSPEEKTQSLIIFLPNASGHFEPFKVSESSIMTETFAARWPELRQFKGYSLENTAKSVRFNYSPRGFYGSIVRPDRQLEYIEPIVAGQTEFYRSYVTSDIPASLENHDLLCGTDGGMNPILPYNAYKNDVANERGVLDPVGLRTYRFIVSTTGEFAQDHGGTKASTLAAIMDYIATFNAIFETELALRLIVIDETENVIFTDPLTAPWSGMEVGGWMNANPGVISQYAPNAQYDLGHNFARYFSGTAIGVAGGRACTTTQQGHRARGSSAGGGPSGGYGNGFIKTTTHEIGHMCSAGHSWNNCPTSADQFAAQSACEPGSGSTLMSYQNSCGSGNDISGSGGLYYNVCNIQEQIRPFVHEGNGSTCGTETITPNNHPVISVAYPDLMYIPISTPFELNATATDADGHALTYNWEGIDRGSQSQLGTPKDTSPLFRSNNPRTQSNRIFPKLSTILANQSDKEEVLPTYDRDVTLVCSVRDNQMGGGGFATALVKMKATTQAGPFVVQMPNLSSHTWVAGGCAEVRWDVANTNKSPVNCASVNIRLSKDGGQTFPIMLASNVPNNGLAYVQVPAGAAAQARVRVEGAGNVFFDLSNANFAIQTATAPAFSLCLSATGSQVCLPNGYSTDITALALGGFTENLTLSASGLPAGGIATFTNPTIGPAGNSTLNLNFSNVAVEGLFTIAVKAVAPGGLEVVRTFDVTIVGNNFSALALTSPVDGSTGIVQSPDLKFVTVVDANQYEVQVSTNPAFNSGDIVASSINQTSGTYKVPVLLEKGKAYYWRVRASNECGTGAWVGPYAFSTVVESCAISIPNDLPLTISTGQVTTESRINVLSGGTISDLNIKKISGSHAEFKDLKMTLKGPDGTTVELVSDICPQSGFFNFGFDDAAPSTFPCPPNNAGLAFLPKQPLSVFNGKNAVGPWTLTVIDNVFGNGGTINGFELEICGSSAQNAPFIVNNNPLTIAPGVNDVVTTTLLKADDMDTPAGNLIFTMVETPKYGHLAKNGLILTAGMQWTQSDIDAGSIRFYDYGNTFVPSDHFRFTVVDGTGGFFGTPSFTILHSVVGTAAPVFETNVQMQPNPASDLVQVLMDKTLQNNTIFALYNLAGQQVQQREIVAGQNNFTFSVVDLPQGMYFMHLSNGQGRMVQKLAVQ